MEQVILVDENDVVTGTMEKMEAHRKSALHRAFSIFIFNSNGDMLLQQRALNKYHSGGLWTNTCCSHPRPGEDTQEAALRRLQEEMGFETPLEKIFDFIYETSFQNGLNEHEFDHVFAGSYDGEISPDKQEVSGFVFRSMEDVEILLQHQPQIFTAWFHLAFPKLQAWWKTNKKQ